MLEPTEIDQRSDFEPFVIGTMAFWATARRPPSRLSNKRTKVEVDGPAVKVGEKSGTGRQEEDPESNAKMRMR